MAEPVHSADAIPLPGGIPNSIGFHKTAADGLITTLWGNQQARDNTLSRYSLPAGATWDLHIPPKIGTAHGAIRISAVSALVRQYGLGCQSWIPLSVFGFGADGLLPRKLLIQAGQKSKCAVDSNFSWCDTAARFPIRSRAPGCPDGSRPCEEAAQQAAAGRLGRPRLMGDNGQFADSESGRAYIAFRFAAMRPVMFLAFGDLEYGRANVGETERAPIKFLTSRHISQMRWGVLGSGFRWSFFKADRDAAYRNIPLNSDHCRMCAAALRSPLDQ